VPRVVEPGPRLDTEFLAEKVGLRRPGDPAGGAMDEVRLFGPPFRFARTAFPRGGVPGRCGWFPEAVPGSSRQFPGAAD